MGQSLPAFLPGRLQLPASALLLGVAEDGLPVLLNLRDPAPSPVLVAADARAGKTRLPQAVARGIELVHDSECVRYAVVTESPEEWQAFELSPHCNGVLAFHHALTTGYLASIACRRPESSKRSSSVFLLIDGFEALASDGDLRDAAQALLQAPPPAGIWAFVTINASRLSWASSWLDAFRVRLIGHVRDRRLAANLTGSTSPFSTELQPPHQFAAREGTAWLPFWLPTVD